MAEMLTPPEPPRRRRRSGPKALYRGKVRATPLSFALTPEAHAALLSALARTGLSRSDYLERLIRADARRG